MGALLGRFLSGDVEGYGEEGSGDGHYPMGFHSLGTLIDSCKGSLKTGHLSMGALLGELGGGLLARDPEGY